MDTPRGVHRILARDYKVRASYARAERGPCGYHQGFPIKSSLKDFSQGLTKNGEPYVTKLLISKETKLKDGEIDCFLVQEERNLTFLGG